MPLVIRELLCGSHRFNDLHCGVPKMSRSLLARRLNEMEAAGLLERRLVGPDDHPEYHLTKAGEELRPIIFQLGFWGKRWVRGQAGEEQPDVSLLMWDLHRRIRSERLPSRRVVVNFEFTDAPREHRRFWLVLEPNAVDLCYKDPGGECDLFVRTDVRTLTDVWMGDFSLMRALKEEAMSLRGPRELRRSFPEWLGLSVFAEMPRELR